VLLGDFFDLWLYPIDVLPATVSDIIQAKANGWITAALRNCVANILKVYYLAGNHDMGVMQSDLQPFNSCGKEIHLILPDDYNANYSGRRHLEHGHAVDMFNAPDNSGDTIGDYPLGYFITRLIATASNRRAARQALNVLLQKLVIDRWVGPVLVNEIINCLMAVAGVQDSTPIRFLEPGLDNITVGEIKSHYGSLYDIWRDRYPNPIDFSDTMLVVVNPDGLGLDWYADKLLKLSDPPKVIVMGHTHHAVSKGAYKNDGCWCGPSVLGHGDRMPHYVEIIGNSATVSCPLQLV
jgi:UDP-2,3-diacylglucosamine pyrophosphatase LpxH